jgi:ribosome-binding protein aMBF1 (putative translation factor)
MHVRRWAMNIYTSQVAGRARQLKEFQAAIHQIDLTIDDDFQRLIVAARGLFEMSDGELADALSVSRPTINRWVNGKNLPYNALRKAVFGWIDRQLTKKIKLVESSVSATGMSASSYGNVAYPMVAKGS